MEISDEDDQDFGIDPRAVKWSDGKPVCLDDEIASFKLYIDKGIEILRNNARFGDGYEIPEKVSDLVFKVKSKKKVGVALWICDRW